MSLKAAHPFVRALALCAMILFGLLLAPVALLSVFGGVPDRISLPLVEQWPLLKILWASNPGAAMPILLQQPLLLIAHSGPGGGAPVWSMFFYPVPLAVQLVVSICVAVYLCAGAREAAGWRLVSALPGMTLLVFVTTYVQLASCCTGGPRWLLDIGMYALAYNTFDTLIDWHALYISVAGALPTLQVALALFGAALLAAGIGRVRSAS